MERFVQRYAACAALASGRTLEVGCGAAIGLGALQATGRAVAGLDYTPAVLYDAQTYYRGRLPLLCADGEQLPLASASFDAVVCLEAIYYMPAPQAFLSEAWRVLRPGGRLLIGSSNPDWPQFVPGDLAQRYPTLPELAAWLHDAGFQAVQVYGGFPLDEETPRLAVALWLRRLLLRTPLRPLIAPVAGRLKRLFYGELAPLPAELPAAALHEAAALLELAPLPVGHADRVHRVIYALGEKA
jgi:SAM-dependent methyltransferase